MSSMLHSGKQVQKHISSSILTEEKKVNEKSIAVQCVSISYDMWYVIHGKGKMTSSIFALLVHLPLIYTYVTFADLYPALAK